MCFQRGHLSDNLMSLPGSETQREREFVLRTYADIFAKQESETSVNRQLYFYVLQLDGVSPQQNRGNRVTGQRSSIKTDLSIRLRPV